MRTRPAVLQPTLHPSAGMPKSFCQTTPPHHAGKVKLEKSLDPAEILRQYRAGTGALRVALGPAYSRSLQRACGHACGHACHLEGWPSAWQPSQSRPMHEDDRNLLITGTDASTTLHCAMLAGTLTGSADRAQTAPQAGVGTGRPGAGGLQPTGAPAATSISARNTAVASTGRKVSPARSASTCQPKKRSLCSVIESWPGMLPIPVVSTAPPPKRPPSGGLL